MKQINREMEEIIQRLQNNAKDEQASDLAQDDDLLEESKPGMLSHNCILHVRRFKSREKRQIEIVMCVWSNYCNLL